MALRPRRRSPAHFVRVPRKGGTVVQGDFEWDSKKAAINARDHEVSFEEATTAFSDERALVLEDPQEHGDRFVLIGMSGEARILYVVHAERIYEEDEERTRIISARVAEPSEAVRYALGDAR